MHNRAVTPAISTILMVAVVVTLAATTSAFVLDLGNEATEPGPNVVLEDRLVDNGESDERLQLTLTHGGPVRANQVMIIASQPVDLGGPDTSPNGDYATVGEKLTEGSDQTGVGTHWEVGETILIGGVGDLEGTTIRAVWTPSEIKKDGQGGKAPSEVASESGTVIWKLTIGK